MSTDSETCWTPELQCSSALHERTSVQLDGQTINGQTIKLTIRAVLIKYARLEWLFWSIMEVTLQIDYYGDNLTNWKKTRLKKFKLLNVAKSVAKSRGHYLEQARKR